MARDEGLEERLREALGDRLGLAAKPMFGGLIWLLDGRMLCGARHDGLMVRLGKGRCDWAMDHPDVAPMVSGGKVMSGWVWAGPEAWSDDALVDRLLAEALTFVATLPPPRAPAPRRAGEKRMPWDDIL